MPTRNLLAGNWKMNTTPSEGLTLIRDVIAHAGTPPCPVVFGVPAIQLMQARAIVEEHPGYHVAAQNMHHEDSGAYTGELSAAMLAAAGIRYVILGHSERRQYFGEDDDLVHTKVRKALAAGLTPIYCCGEPLDVRESGDQNILVGKQVEQALFALAPEQIKKVVIAYEPVWAIGTGKTASPAQAQDMHRAIRGMISNQFGSGVADNMTILYGGSVKPGNAQELFAGSDVDGGLVGGASLDAAGFAKIVGEL